MQIMIITVTAAGTLTANNKNYRCALGRAGVADAAQKREGDGATPTGCYPLRAVYYRADRIAKPNTKLTLFEIKPDDGWCDAPDDPNYNRLVELPYAASHENLWRNDNRYDVIVVLGHNDDPVVSGAGSCIFWHVAEESYAPTAGCVAMPRDELLQILSTCNLDTVMTISR